MARPANPELRSEILKAATRIIETCGPDCVTMREVAEAVGYSPTTLYLYFKDKSEVLKETIKLAAEDLADSLSASAVGPTPLDELRQRGRAYLVWGLMHPGLYQLMFQSPGDIAWSEEELSESTRAGSETNEVIERCIAEGQIGRPADLPGFQTALFAALHGATSLAISRRLPDALGLPSQELVRAAASVADRLVNALLDSVCE